MGRSTEESRNRIIERVAYLMHLCDTRRVLPSLESLAEEMKVNPRTVRRYLNGIERVRSVPPVLWTPSESGKGSPPQTYAYVTASEEASA